MDLAQASRVESKPCILPHFLPLFGPHSIHSGSAMAQFVYTMHRVGKVVPPKRESLKDISLSFFPGAKIGGLGHNGSGKSTLLRIMAGADQAHNGEARPAAGE